MSGSMRLVASIPLVYWATVGFVAFVQPPSAMSGILAPLVIVLNLAAMISAPVLAVAFVRAFFRDAPGFDKAWVGAGLGGGIASWVFLLWLLRGIIGAFGGR